MSLRSRPEPRSSQLLNQLTCHPGTSLLHLKVYLQYIIKQLPHHVYKDVHQSITYHSKKSGHKLGVQLISAAILNDDVNI